MIEKKKIVVGKIVNFRRTISCKTMFLLENESGTVSCKLPGFVGPLPYKKGDIVRCVGMVPAGELTKALDGYGHSHMNMEVITVARL